MPNQPDPTVTPDMRDPDTPDDVDIRSQARTPVSDPTMGIQVSVPAGEQSANRLVVLGDSLSHGFQSGAIFNTDWSYPAIIARELGWYDSFRHPEYRAFGGLGINIEYLIRHLEHEFGAHVDWYDVGLALFYAHHLLTQVRDYWEHGPGAQVPVTSGIMHNLAVSGFDIRDLLSSTADTEKATMEVPKDGLFHPLAANAGQLMAMYVLSSARDSTGRALTPMQAAQALGDDGGIETLIVFIGANNALGTVLDLNVRWSGDGYDTPQRRPAFNCWRPTHFISELKHLADAIEQVNARHVIWGTVPHVTIAPVARGVTLPETLQWKGKVREGSRYFAYYTRPWISDDEFDPASDPYLTGQQARAIDSAIDQYNDAIADTVKNARRAGRDWLLLDTAGLLDRIAVRRYVEDPKARPDWWTPYVLPQAIGQLQPTPDSRFWASGSGGRTAGGIFALDGVHPTTIAYGMLAQEFIKVMNDSGVQFSAPNGTPRQAPVNIDFQALIRQDSLVSSPPASATSDMATLRWLQERWDWVQRLSHILRGVP